MSEASRVLVLGAGGMLGRACLQAFRQGAPGCAVVASSRDGRGGHQLALDPLAPDAAPMVALLETARPAVVINALGVLASAIDGSAGAAAAAALVNGWLPHVLVTEAARRGIRVVHVSSDAVFSGRGPDRLTESTPPDPVDAYGWSKALGESRGANVLTVRCSIVGADRRGRGLAEWYLQAPVDVPVRGYTDYRWTPVTAAQLARWFVRVVVDDAFDAVNRGGAVVHFAPNPPLTKFEFLSLLRRLAGGGAPIVPASSPSGPVSRLLAMRPALPALSDPTTWDALLGELLASRTGVPTS